MSPDDEICLCFHVSKRKIVNWIRVNQPLRAAQLSECFGAGTGCGWCRPFLKKLFELDQTRRESSENAAPDDDLNAEQYRNRRAQYLLEKKGKPPV